jgi:hypothetical protein
MWLHSFLPHSGLPCLLVDHYNYYIDIIKYLIVRVLIFFSITLLLPNDWILGHHMRKRVRAKLQWCHFPLRLAWEWRRRKIFLLSYEEEYFVFSTDGIRKTIHFHKFLNVQHPLGQPSLSYCLFPVLMMSRV